MRLLINVSVLLALAASSQADELPKGAKVIPLATDDSKVPDVPEKLQVQPGQFAVIRIGKDVEAIYGFDQSKCPLIKLQSEEGELFYLVNPTEPGSYPVMFRFKDSNRGKLCVIDAGKPTPPPPPKPEVDEALRKKLRDAYQRDGGDKDKNPAYRALLVELYQQAAGLALKADSPDTLLAQLKSASESLARDRDIQQPDVLESTRSLIADEIGKVLTLGMVFTDANRRQAAELFLRLSVALGW